MASVNSSSSSVISDCNFIAPLTAEEWKNFQAVVPSELAHLVHNVLFPNDSSLADAPETRKRGAAVLTSSNEKPEAKEGEKRPRIVKKTIIGELEDKKIRGFYRIFYDKNPKSKEYPNIFKYLAKSPLEQRGCHINSICQYLTDHPNIQNLDFRHFSHRIESFEEVTQLLKRFPIKRILLSKSTSTVGVAAIKKVREERNAIGYPLTVKYK